jgi:hypothetical protein
MILPPRIDLDLAPANKTGRHLVDAGLRDVRRRVDAGT